MWKSSRSYFILASHSTAVSTLKSITTEQKLKTNSPPPHTSSMLTLYLKYASTPLSERDPLYHKYSHFMNSVGGFAMEIRAPLSDVGLV